LKWQPKAAVRSQFNTKQMALQRLLTEKAVDQQSNTYGAEGIAFLWRLNKVTLDPIT